MRFKHTAKLIKDRRERLNLSQGDLGKAMGVHLQVISNIERGVSGVAAIRAKRLAKALEIPVNLIAVTAAKDYQINYMKQL